MIDIPLGEECPGQLRQGDRGCEAAQEGAGRRNGTRPRDLLCTVRLPSDSVKLHF